METSDQNGIPRDTSNSTAQEAFWESTPDAKVKVRILLSYLLGYLLSAALWFWGGRSAYLYPIAGALFTAMVLSAFPKSRRCCEHWLWLIGLWVLIFMGMCREGVIGLNSGRIWEGSALPSLVFLPFFAGYWALTASGCLAEGKSGRWVALDAVRAFLLVPFGNLFGRLRALNAIRLERRYRGHKNRLGATVAALTVAAVLFTAAFALLMDADDGFNSLIHSLPKPGDLHIDLGGILLRLILSIPFGAYLYGQVEGLSSLRSSEIETQRSLAQAFLKRLRRVGTGLWASLLCCFSALYFLFAFVQGKELIAACVSNWAPGTLTMADFAKQGFFEMCAVMALNFALIWIAEHSCEASLRQSLFGKLALTLIMLCSLLFAASALIKLIMYLRSFGFTALRLQGAWGISVLLAGCLCTLVWIWKGKDLAKAWIFYAAVSLCATFVY